MHAVPRVDRVRAHVHLAPDGVAGRHVGLLIGANVAGLALGRRRLRVVVDESLSLEERQLMERLDPSYWVEHAPDRGLSGHGHHAPGDGAGRHPV